MIELTYQLLDTNALVERATSPAVGAVVLFLGVTRHFPMVAKRFNYSTKLTKKWPAWSCHSWKKKHAIGGQFLSA